MSTTVVPAPAEQAKRLDESKKLTKETQAKQAAQAEQVAAAAEQQAADDEGQKAKVQDETISVAVPEEAHEADATHEAELSLEGDFSFEGALADAAASASSLVSEADAADEAGFAQMGEGGSGGTILLVGAVALVGLGIYVLADGGDNDGGYVNSNPVFANATQTLTVDENDSVQGTATATDPDGDTITYTASNPANGTVTFGTGGAFTYTPNAGFAGTDTFTITASDGQGGTATQTVNVTINENSAPEFGPEATTELTVAEDTAGTFIVDLVDPDGDDTAIVLVGAITASNGTISGGTNGEFTYTPDADFFGTDTISLTVRDEAGEESTLTIPVTITPVNDAPVVNATQTVEVDENTTFGIAVAATDPDGDDLTYSVTTDPANGTLAAGDNPGEFDYTPDADFRGQDSFVVTISDGNGGVVTQTVTVNVVGDLIDTSIDVGALPETPTQPRVFEAGDTAYNFTDDANVSTFVQLNGFGDDDVITVTNAEGSDYSFTTGVDPNDLRINFNNGTASNEIIINDILPDDAGFIFNLETAIAEVGFNFINFA